MPRFSVIVPVYQVQAGLDECLESVLSQSFMDLELIAVDDCSPDACGAIVDEFAARDPRVRPVHLTENQGPARARDAGLYRATGDYLVLLDGGDTLTPDALWSIETRLKETGEPDVLVYDSARTDRTGRTIHGDVTGRPGTCRRDFVEREGLTFAADCHEDTPWTYPVPPAAASIASLDRVCVHHRQPRRDGVPGTTGRRHFDVLERHDRAFPRPGRMPRGCRAKFLRRARTYHRRHLAPGVRLPLRPRLRPALVRLALHRTFRALRMAMTLRRRTAKAVVKLLRALRAVLLQAHHRIRPCLPPHADRALFSASTTPRCRRPAPDTPPAGRRRPARVLTGGHVRGFRSAQLRAVFRERFCPYGDGRAAERMVRQVVPGQGGEAAGPPPVVPLAERHPVPWPAADPVRSRPANVPQPAGRQTVTDGH
ncbi:hypothetical protein GCM10014715_54150 [Streptomyces spiralis]|uniref:Glycosyltransferase 2-like domain-containing protein n=1 Tax=Streptomyces spiralis TaxID=66376 RepID=A0A919A836_9ACTN|nr:glycosyltransferase family 2 protein [Streptomyces spiralis]GHE90852.1 hypothetical protein GCM10014715_54150 [Streptomyces spiralis]